MAACDGAIALMLSTWHFLMMPVIYLAMCSLRVKTLPCPIGAFGPRKANQSQS